MSQAQEIQVPEAQALDAQAPITTQAPEDPEQPQIYTREYFDIQWRASIDEDLARGDFSCIRKAISNQVPFLAAGYCDARWPREEQERTLHKLWYLFYHAGRRVPHESAEHDRMAFDLLKIQGEGPLMRRSQDDETIWEICTVSPGEVVWSELPLLVSDMTEYWVKDCASTGHAHRLNLSYFLAKVSAAGACTLGLFQIALILLKDVFETERPVGTPRNEHQLNDVDPDGKTEEDLTVADLLPSVIAWFREAGNHIVRITDIQWNNYSNFSNGSSDLISPGHLFASSPLGKSINTSSYPFSSIGFHPKRYIFWLKRLEQIIKDAKQEGDDELANLALDVTEKMLFVFDGQDYQLRDEIEAEGEIVGTVVREDEFHDTIHHTFKSHEK